MTPLKQNDGTAAGGSNSDGADDKSQGSPASPMQKLYSDPRLKDHFDRSETRARRKERMRSGIPRGACPPGINPNWDELKQRRSVSLALAAATTELAPSSPPKGLPVPPGLMHPIRVLFDEVDKDGDGCINVREMIIGLRKLPDLAALLCLPQRVSQEDGTRDALVAVFQGMDKNDDRDITWDEFLEWFLEMRAKNSNVNNNSGAAASGGSSGHQRIDTVAQSALVPLKSEILLK